MVKFRQIFDPPKRIFALGDIHGCGRELSVMLDFLKSKERLSKDDLIIFIGDYIDRGPDTRGVIDQLIKLKSEHTNVVFLKGNHEDMFLNFLGLPGNMGDVYLTNGGRQTLHSYQVGLEDTVKDILEKIPEDHMEFFNNLESCILVSDFIFAHAGLDPMKEMDQQLDSDLYWIRENFIANTHKFGKIVIFGHTPYQDVMFDLPYKIGLDTGLVYGNRLSCLEFSSKRILQVDYGENKVKVRAFPVPLEG